MRIALVHELLTMKGGAERVLRVLARQFPDAPIFTLLYDEKKMSDWFPPERIRTSPLQSKAQFLNHYPLSIIHYPFDHHLYLKKFPAAVESWDFSGFDLVISSSSAFAHGLITNGSPPHLSFIHSPARYLWDRTHDVRWRADRGLWGPLKRTYLSRTFHALRIWDAEAAARPDLLVAASAEVQRRIQLYWRRESTVLHPPIDDFWFKNQMTNDQAPMTNPSQDTSYPLPPAPYHLIVSTLAPYKRLDIAVEACTRGSIPLIIAGDGPDRKRLEKMAGPTVRFLGHQDNAQLRTLYRHATATLFVGEEDFGLVPLESMACGTPVIAYRAGGALETVIEGETGTFFDEQTPDALLSTIRAFDHKKYSKETCRSHAEKFRESSFVQNLLSQIELLTGSSVKTA